MFNKKFDNILFTSTVVLAITGGAIEGVTSKAQASILVDNLEDIGLDGTVVNTRNIGGVTVNLTSDNGNDFLAGTYNNNNSFSFFAGLGGVINAPRNPDNVSGSRFISTGSIRNAIPFEFTFSRAVKGFGFTTIDLLENGVRRSNFFEIKAFDSGDNEIDSQILTGSQGATGLDLDWYVSSSNANITRVTFDGRQSSIGENYGIDDLTLDVESVPEPLTILGTGMALGFGTLFRKKKSSV